MLPVLVPREDLLVHAGSDLPATHVSEPICCELDRDSRARGPDEHAGKLLALDPDVLDRAVRAWAAQRSTGEEPVAIDGKSVRGAARQIPDGQDLLVAAAAEHCCGLILGQEAVPDKSNEIPAVRTLTSELALAGRVVTVDALHTRDHTARRLVENCQAHYVMAAVKSNRLALLTDLAGLDWERPEVRATEHPDAGPRTNDTGGSRSARAGSST